MFAEPESTKCCHLIWITHGGRSWFKIAEAARFCERAARDACTTLGWTPDLVAVFPDRVHLLVKLPWAEDRRTISRRLQRAATRLLAGSQALPRLRTPLWDGDGWCVVLPNAASAAVVRANLRRWIAQRGPRHEAAARLSATRSGVPDVVSNTPAASEPP